MDLDCKGNSLHQPTGTSAKIFGSGRAAMREKKSAGTDILSGWKEIAAHLGKGVRTVQRYESLGLPLHRVSGRSTGAVFALKREINRWIANGPDRQQLRLEERTNKAGADFLRVDSEIALTFAALALHTTDEEKRRRTTQVARKAYDSIMRLRKCIDLSEAERQRLDANLQRLKSELLQLGESF